MFESRNGDLKRCHVAYTCASDSDASHKVGIAHQTWVPQTAYIYAAQKVGMARFMLMTTPEHPAFVVELNAIPECKLQAHQ